MDTEAGLTRTEQNQKQQNLNDITDYSIQQQQDIHPLQLYVEHSPKQTRPGS